MLLLRSSSWPLVMLMLMLALFTSCNYDPEFYEKLPDDLAEESLLTDTITDTSSAPDREESTGGETGSEGTVTGGSTGSSTGGSTGGETDPGTGGSTGGNTGGETDPGTGGTTGGSTGGETDPGTGSNPDPIVLENVNDLFAQNISDTINKVDIVWVVDNSGSMGDDQKALASNFSAFINDFITKSIDFKMGVTTTDGRSQHNGRFVHDSDLLTKDRLVENQSKFINDFQDTIKVGVRGSNSEKAFQTMANSTFYEKNFFREDALLAIIVVSDEPEQSNGSVDSYVQTLVNFKGHEDLVKVYTIYNDSTRYKSYSYAHSYIEKMMRFPQIAEKTGGASASIKKDFYSALDNFGGKIVDLLNSFVLTKVPHDPSAIQVLVDGVVQTEGISYNAETNSIVFDGNWVPAEGASIEIIYQSEVK